MQFVLRLIVPRRVVLGAGDATRQGCVDFVHVRAQRQDMEQGVKQAVATLLDQIGRAAVAHKRCAGVATDDGARERGWDERRFHRAAATRLGQVHALVETAKQDERHLFLDEFTHCCVIGFLTWEPRHCKLAGHAHFGFQKLANASGIGVGGDHRKTGSGKEILGDRAPQIPNRLDGGVAFALDKRFWVQTQQFAELA